MQGVKGSSLYGKCLPNVSQNGVSQRASSMARKAAVVKAEIGDSLVGLRPFVMLCASLPFCVKFVACHLYLALCVAWVIPT